MRAAWVVALALASGLRAEANPDFTLRAGARALAMGEALAAAQQGLDALAWNPAGLAREGSAGVLLGHTDWISQPSESLAASLPLGPGTLGLVGHFNGAPPLDRRDAQGNVLGSLSYSNMGGSLVWAQALGSLDLGLSAGGWQMDLAGQSSAGAQLAAGAAYSLGPVRLGVAGNQLESSPAVQASLLWQTAVGSGSLGLGGGYIGEGKDSRWGLGLEADVLGRLALRVGWQQAVQTAVTQGFGGLSAGMGLTLGSLSLDYAWMPVAELGQVQRMQMGWKFNAAGTAPKELAAPREALQEAERPVQALAEPVPQAQAEAQAVPQALTATVAAEPEPAPTASPVPETPKKEVKMKFVVPAD